MTEPITDISLQPRKSSTVTFLLSLVVLIFGLNAVDFDYTGPARHGAGTTCTRHTCMYYADLYVGPDHYGCHYSVPADSGGGCPGIVTAYFNPTDCGWPPGVSCSLGCSYSGPAGCSGVSDGICTCSTYYDPPATMTAYTDCSLPGSHGWCRATATLNITADEPMPGYVITDIESSMGGLLPGCIGLNASHATCSYIFPGGRTAFNFWALSTYGDQSGSQSVSMDVDGGIPVLVDVLTPGAPGLRGWYRGGPVTLECTASDAVSGLASLTYAGGTPIPGGVTATADGTDTLSCTATDVAGNAVTASHTANIDTVPPTLQVLYNENPVPSGWGAMHLTATASDATSGVYTYGFSVNGGPLQTDVTLGDGYYTIVGYAEDNAGNTTITNATVGVDTAAPSTYWTFASGGWVRGTVTLSGHSNDAGSGVAAVFISFDATNWIRVGSDPDWFYKWDTTQVGDGPYMILARATDMAGNEEHTAALIIYVDNTNPLVEMDKEWTAPGKGGANGWDAMSGIARARVTISGNGITPLVRDYGSVPSSIDWYGKDGRGVLAPYGDYGVTLEAWDRAGNYNVTTGIIHRLAPPTEAPKPTRVPAGVIVHPTPVPTKVPEVIAGEPVPELPKGLPFWSAVLPLVGLGIWLAGSNIAIARDRRFRELRGIRQVVGRYRDQNKINFPQEGEND
jgi:hypothetical protein